MEGLCWVSVNGCLTIGPGLDCDSEKSGVDVLEVSKIRSAGVMLGKREVYWALASLQLKWLRSEGDEVAAWSGVRGPAPLSAPYFFLFENLGLNIEPLPLIVCNSPLTSCA